MTSFLKDFVMPDELPSGDRAVYVFIEMIALGFVLVAITALVLAIVFFLVGIKWTSLKSRIWPTWAERIDRAAGDYRFRYGLPLLLVGAAGIYTISYLQSLRNDLDMYVMPRVVTEKQAAALRTALSSNPNTWNVQLNICSNVGDREATEFAGQLFNAIRNGGWDAQFAHKSLGFWSSKLGGQRV